MNILIAPNAFKNSASATEAAKALSDGFARSSSKYKCILFPIGDGGDGTAKLLMNNLGAKSLETTVKNPLGKEINASLGYIEARKTAIIEMASASGIRLLDTHELDPMQSSSYGTGQLMRFALDLGARKIILCMGGSATVDGGMGILNALGIRFYQADKELEAFPQQLLGMQRIDTSLLDARVLETEIVILCDVGNKLLGNEGAAAVFGPQKGASPSMVLQLDRMLSLFRDLSIKTRGKDMGDIKSGGTAGGAAAGLWAYINARLVNGIDYFLDITGFDTELQNSAAVITGEGSIDLQTLEGKGPYGIAVRAKQKGVPVIGIAGRVPLHEEKALRPYFDVLLSIGNEPDTIQMAIQNTTINLERIGYEIGNLLKIGKPL